MPTMLPNPRGLRALTRAKSVAAVTSTLSAAAPVVAAFVFVVATTLALESVDATRWKDYRPFTGNIGTRSRSGRKPVGFLTAFRVKPSDSRQLLDALLPSRQTSILGSDA